ncbi:hypothetical protein MMC22_010488 [Lobaria immixta]|nr:hypothetical protein [Lobaria immixta]
MQYQPAQSAIVISLNAACLNRIIRIVIFAVRNHISKLFTYDADVIPFVSRIIPIYAAYPPFEPLPAIYNGVLRGLKRQKVDTWVGPSC